MNGHISQLTMDRLTWLISSEQDGSEKNSWIRSIMVLCGIPLQGKTDHDEMYRLISAWVTDTRAKAIAACLASTATDRRCDPRIVTLTRGVGINPLALSIIGKAIDAPASVDMRYDMNDPYDLRPFSATSDEHIDSIMIPLAREVYWNGRHLYVKSGVLSDTLIVAVHGRPACEIIDHPELRRYGVVTGVKGTQGDYEVLHVSGGDLQSWRDTVLMMRD
jgi:hypothetical protein